MEKIFVTIDSRPDFDRALEEAIKKCRDKLEIGVSESIWDVSFVLKRVLINDDYNYASCEYEFEVTKERG